MEYLVDTGVLLRLFDRTDSSHTVIRGSLKHLRSKGDTLVTTSQNIGEFWNVSTRPREARGGYGQSVAETHRRVSFIERLGQVITESNASYLEWRSLVQAQAVTGVSVHDARLVSIMNVNGIAKIVTLNARDFERYDGISAITPDEVLAE